MVIPKGKKFKFRGFNGERDKKNPGQPAKSEGGQFYEIPSKGYLGLAQIGQDINLQINNQFTKPLEGVLDKVPHIADIGMRVFTKDGVGLRNNRFSSMKYWVGPEPMSLDFQFIFETQVDSYFDVYEPVRNLMMLALPGETDEGFYEPPTPTIKYIAKEATKFVDTVVSKTRGTGALAGAVNAIGQTTKQMSNAAAQAAKNIERSGFTTDLYVGNNFYFKNLLIKNITPTFSSELAYAPIYYLNNLLGKNIKQKSDPPKEIFNPKVLGEYTTQLLSQTMGAILALGNAGAQSVGQILGALPKGIRDRIGQISELPAFPIRAEVNMSIETQFPLTRNAHSKSFKGTELSENHIQRTFIKNGNNDLGY